MKKVLPTIGICLLVSAVAAQEGSPPSLQITPGARPLIFNRAPPANFGSITITEIDPAALKDGYFAIYLSAPYADYGVSFTSESTAVGSVGATPVRTAPMDGSLNALVVQVDAEADRIDSITVTPHGSIAFDATECFAQFANGIVFVLTHEPTPWEFFAEGKGTDLGSFNFSSFSFGTFAGAGGINIGDGENLNLRVGETRTLQLDYAGSRPPFNDVESLDPSIAEIESYTLTDLTITARGVGKTTVMAADARGCTSGNLPVAVSPSAGEPEPEPKLAEPMPRRVTEN